MLVREQYPSIQGHRYLTFGSMAVLFNSQSREPRRAFSRRTRSLEAVVPALDGDKQLESSATVLRPRAPFSNSRRVNPWDGEAAPTWLEDLRRPAFISFWVLT